MDMLVPARQPRIRRAKASTTKATYTHPDHVETYVMSATHRVSGAAGVKTRPTRSRPAQQRGQRWWCA